jgi:hypothetical protein
MAIFPSAVSIGLYHEALSLAGATAIDHRTRPTTPAEPERKTALAISAAYHSVLRHNWFLADLRAVIYH